MATQEGEEISVDIILYESDELDRKKSPITLPHNSFAYIKREIQLTPFTTALPSTVVACLIRSNFLIEEFTSEEMMEVFKQLQNKEDIKDEEFSIVQLSNVIQNANMSAKEQKVDIFGYLQELERLQEMEGEWMKGRKEISKADLKKKTEQKKKKTVNFGEISLSVEFLRKFVQVYLNFGKLWRGHEDSDSELSESEEINDEESEEVQNPSNPFRSDKKDKKIQLMKAKKELTNKLRSICSFKKMFLFLNYNPKNKECEFAKIVLDQVKQAVMQISKIFSLAFFNLETPIRTFQSQNLLQLYFGNVNSSIFASKQADKVIRLINNLEVINFDYEDDSHQIEIFNKDNLLSIDEFVSIYFDVTELFLPKLKQFFKLIQKFTYSSTSAKVLSCQSNKYFKVYQTPGLTLSTSALSESHNISMFEIAQEAGSIIGVDSFVVDIRIHDDNLLYMFEDVQIGTLNEKKGFALINLTGKNDKKEGDRKIMKTVFQKLEDIANEIMTGIKIINKFQSDSKGEGINLNRYRKKVPLNELTSKNQSYLPSFSIDENVRIILLGTQNQNYEESGFDPRGLQTMDFHPISDPKIADKIHTGNFGALYIDMVDENGYVYKTYCVVLEREKTMNEQSQIIFDTIHCYELRLKMEYIKKNLYFDEDTIGWFNKFADYLDVVKSFSEKVCSPVFNLILKQDCILKLKYLTENFQANTGVGRVNLDSLLNNSLNKTAIDLRKLKFNNSMLDSTILIVSLLSQVPIFGLEGADDLQISDLISLLNNFSENAQNLAPISGMVSPSSHISIDLIKELDPEIDISSEMNENSSEDQSQSKSQSLSSIENNEYGYLNYNYKAIGVLIKDAEYSTSLYYWLQEGDSGFDENCQLSQLGGYWQKSNSGFKLSDYEMKSMDVLIGVYQKQEED